MKKKYIKMNWTYLSKLTDVLLDGSMGVLWLINAFAQLFDTGFNTTSWVCSVMSALLSAAWFVLAYHQWEQLKTIPKTIEEKENES